MQHSGARNIVACYVITCTLKDSVHGPRVRCRVFPGHPKRSGLCALAGIRHVSIDSPLYQAAAILVVMRQ